MPEPRESKVGRKIAFVLCLAVIGAMFLLAVKELMPERSYASVPDYEPWDAEVVEVAKGIPVQTGGRVKPLETHAGVLMLGMRGDRLMKIEGADGEIVKIRPIEWLLDALFRPQVAMGLPSFRVDNSEVIELIGLEGKEKRDRYSYNELEAARAKLFELGGRFEEMQRNDEDLERVESQTLALARLVRQFETLISYFAFGRAGIELRGANADQVPNLVRTSTLMATAGELRGVIADAQARGEQPPAHVTHILRQITDLSNAAKFGLPALPPPEKDVKEWLTAGNRIWNVMTGSDSDPEGAIKDIGAMEVVVATQIQEPREFAAKLNDWRGDLEERARARGEYRSIPVELSYNRANWFFRALFFCFLPGALFLALGLLSPAGTWGKAMRIGVWVFSLVGLVLLCAGIIQRSVIMERPPVGNLFETIPFITAVVVGVILIVEVITRRGLALGIAPLMGFVGLVLARRYEFGDGTDTMDPLIAVLRSNFWLTTHVLTITAGYAAGLVAAVVGLIYVLRRVLGLDGDDKGGKGTRRFLTRMTYGLVCFTLFLSLVGTVLGGIWANYSWGRFWGWDPKENGALMIVLWNLFILHGRLGGFLREWGINLAGLFGAVVVTFSWWHVNLLGVGLHSYGFSDSKKMMVFGFYGLIGFVLLVGIGYMFYEHAMKKAAKAENLGAPEQAAAG